METEKNKETKKFTLTDKDLPSWTKYLKKKNKKQKGAFGNSKKR